MQGVILMNRKERLKVRYLLNLISGIILITYNALVIPKNRFAGLLIAVIASGLIVNGLMNLQKLKIHKQDLDFCDAEERLRNLKKLLKDGLITENEYEKKRHEIIEKDL